MLGISVMFSSFITISHKVRVCTGRGGVKCFFCLMAVKVTGPGGFAGGPGSLLFMMLWIVNMVWPCVLRVMCGLVMRPLGHGKAMRGAGVCPRDFDTTL